MQTTVQKSLFQGLHVQKIKPLLKWAGGKSKLLPVLRNLIPPKIDRYVEPFLGGGALFFDLALPHSLVSDSNPELINFYIVVRDFPDELLKSVKIMPVTKKDFYKIRAQIPKSLSPVERAARFIYLNKTCFNGLYRVNRKGQFNTPFGGRTHVKIADEDNLYRAASLLKQVDIKCIGYSMILTKLTKKDFVYLDPPYVPISRYSDFNRYTRDFFTDDDQIQLAEEFRKISDRGVKALLSILNYTIALSLTIR